MRNKSLETILALLIISIFLTSCTIRSYTVRKQRLDQDLTRGNRGFMQGTPPPVDKGRKTTRAQRVFEIEWRPPIKFEKVKPEEEQQDLQLKQETSLDELRVQPLTVESKAVVKDTQQFKMYKIQKSDTLQKISKKFYGTTKKYYKIYKANKGILKSPDKIIPGQVIRIPIE